MESSWNQAFFVKIEHKAEKILHAAPKLSAYDVQRGKMPLPAADSGAANRPESIKIQPAANTLAAGCGKRVTNNAGW